MKGNDEITGLFRSRLSGAEMTVRDGFWEELKGDLSRVETDATNTSATVAFGQAGTCLDRNRNVLSLLHASTGWLRRLL